MRFASIRRTARRLPRPAAGRRRRGGRRLARQDTLTKPQGSLGRLEEMVAWLARWQGRAMPRLDRVAGAGLRRLAWRDARTASRPFRPR